MFLKLISTFTKAASENFIIVNNSTCHLAMVTIYLVASGFETRVTRRIPLVEQKLPTIAEQVSTTFLWHSCCSILNFCVVFVDQHLSFSPISFGHYIVCYFSIDLRLCIFRRFSFDMLSYSQ
jgi:hypothetical protein